jgi:hypothetical protein
MRLLVVVHEGLRVLPQKLPNARGLRMAEIRGKGFEAQEKTRRAQRALGKVKPAVEPGGAPSRIEKRQRRRRRQENARGDREVLEDVASDTNDGLISVGAESRGEERQNIPFDHYSV